MVKSLDVVWKDLLFNLLKSPITSSPRGINTRELPIGQMLHIDMCNAVLMNKERKLSRRFMLGEAIWIMRGDNSVEGIAPYNPRIAQFSDDGVTFFGAYGPKVAGQRDYVVRTLLNDRNSRQATINIWRENPPKTRDVPCTVSMSFYIRGSSSTVLDMAVYMRSSDAWLGLPYDAFNFSMIATGICAEFNKQAAGDYAPIVPGTLALALGSSHLYQQNEEQGRKAVVEPVKVEYAGFPWLVENHGGWDSVVSELERCLEDPSARWWKEAW